MISFKYWIYKEVAIKNDLFPMISSKIKIDVLYIHLNILQFDISQY